MQSKYLINDQPLVILPRLAAAIGLNEAIVLQQVHYWLMTYERAGKVAHFIDGRWWVYNAYRQWQQDNFPFWSVVTIGRIVRSLEKAGLLISARHSENSYDRKKWYTIAYDVLDRLIETNHASYQIDTIEDIKLTPRSCQSDTIITETTEKTRESSAQRARRACRTAIPADVINPVKDAIVAAFGWGWETITKAAAGEIQSAARQLCLAGYTAADIPSIYQYCRRFDNFGPMALAKHAHEWRKRQSLIVNHNGVEPPPVPIVPKDFKVFFKTGQFAGMYQDMVASGEYDRLKAEGLIQ